MLRKRHFHGISVALCVALILPLIIVLRDVFLNTISFWYDNARDLLAGWDNLSKLTLIGPPSGIPGIFYGPYWIWLISIGLFFSKDPRIVNILLGVVPYCILFPILLLRFHTLFDKKTVIILYTLFVFNFGIGYATNLWNPHLAPIIFFTLIYLLVSIDLWSDTRSTYAALLLAGLVQGVLINVHMSFGSGILLGLLLYYFFFFVRAIFVLHKKDVWIKLLSKVVCFMAGIAVAYLPFMVFELRHGFAQTSIALDAFSKYGGVVQVTGLSKMNVLALFLSKASLLLGVPLLFSTSFIAASIAYAGYLMKTKKMILTALETRLLVLVLFCMSGILTIYLTAHNPIWEYHFIGTEMLFLLLLGLLVSKVPIIKQVLFIWALFFLVGQSVLFFQSTKHQSKTFSSLSAKEYITDLIAHDAKNKSYSVFSYSPSIYQYDYSYLFRWRAKKSISYDPGAVPQNAPLVYVIVPHLPAKSIKDYVDYRSPETTYKTSKTWQIENGDTVIKRVRR